MTMAAVCVMLGEGGGSRGGGEYSWFTCGLSVIFDFWGLRV